MLNSISRIKGLALAASDGAIGHVKEAFFDDQSWTIRYLVVDTGGWLSGRNVLVSPYSVRQPLRPGQPIDVALSRQQVQDSPDIDTHQPVSRRAERQYNSYYAYPEYWVGDGLWPMGPLPVLPPPLPGDAGTPAEAAARAADDVPAEDVHLRSSAAVAGYAIQASDDTIGHVDDFLFDDASWAIRYLVVDTRNWWPGGKKVLIGTHWIERIEWTEKTVHVRLTRQQVKDGPAYDESVVVDRDYEKRLHSALGRQGYWD